MWHKITIFTFCILLSVSCTTKKENGVLAPKDVLKEYINQGFSAHDPSVKVKLLALTTGSVRETLESLSADDFTNYFIEPEKKFIALKLKDERKLGPSRYAITYEITYVAKNETLMNSQGEPSEDRVTNKKHATFVLEEGKWLISEVKNIKTYIEHKDALSL